MQACLAQWFLRTLGSGNLRGSAYSAVLIADEVNLELVEWCHPARGLPLIGISNLKPIPRPVNGMNKLHFGEHVGKFTADFLDMTVHSSVAHNAVILVDAIH